ncbi:MAG: DUF58 domain-containing protein [Flavobacteriaceae bacterium]
MKILAYIKSFYLHQRVYWVLAFISLGFLLSYWLPVLFSLFVYVLLLFGLIFILDGFMLFRFSNSFLAKRKLPKKLSNSDENLIQIELINNYPFKIFVEIIDELPSQFQKRDFYLNQTLESGETAYLDYSVRPVERGAYIFGNLNCYISSKFKLIKKRMIFNAGADVAVYPSFIQMRNYEFLAFNKRLTQFGLKKIRRIGHSMEFEQIKNYIAGDDFRTINWKATAKRAQLMVNQFQDEKSQPIYALIDTGRAMKMPFEGLKLLDYAINSALAFSNIALLKKDKAGLVTFSKKVETSIKARSKKNQLQQINEALYAIDTEYLEADYGYLYSFLKRHITQRSLLILYTNFEHISALKRQLPYLQAIAKHHLLVVVFFENTELDNLLQSNVEDLQSIYHQTIAQKFALEKQQILKELKLRGIFGILTKPQNLTVNVINKYLEFKAKGLI